MSIGKNDKFVHLNVGFFVRTHHRVATAQGKQGIWLLTFPDRENTGNLVNLIFYTGKIVPTQENFENLEFFENFAIKVATR